MVTNTLGPENIIEKKKRYLIPCVYHFYRRPPQIVGGEKSFLIDSQGRRYLDLYSGVSVNALGHCHPEITEAICQQVKTLQHTTTIYLTEPIVNLAEALAQVLSGDLCRSFFCASGSEANEGAALLATLYTGRQTFLALKNSLHGRTKLAMSLTGLDFWQTDPDPVAGITHIPAPHCRQCPFNQQFGHCRYECVQAVENAIVESSEKPAAMFVEPIQGNGGIITPPDEYFLRLRQVLDQHNVLLVADEVQTGFGRTGEMFAMSHWGVVPDILTGGKALGGGTPTGYFATTDEIAQCYTRPGASTFGGNPVTAQAGLMFLQILQRDNMLEIVRSKGAFLRERLEQLAEKFTFINDVRGRGLMLGMEIGSVNSTGAAEATDTLLERMKDEGFLLGKTGPDRNVLTFMPPFIIEESDLQRSIDTLERVFEEF